MKANSRTSKYVALQTKIIRLSLAGLLLLNLLGAPMVTAQINSTESDIKLIDDLRMAIILAGYPCKLVTEFTQPNSSDYQVSCDAEKHYRIQVSEEKDILVNSRSGPSATEPQDETNHDVLMKRQLVSIVNLAGHDCSLVESYTKGAPKDHIVTCRNKTMYRIHVTPEGRVAVDKQPLDQ